MAKLRKLIKDYIIFRTMDYVVDGIESAMTKPSINNYNLECEVHQLVNNERKAKGLSLLLLDDRLSNIARMHSQDMALNNFFDHVNPRGQDPSARADAQRYNSHKDFGTYYMDGIGENIFFTDLFSYKAHVLFMPVHKWHNQSSLANAAIQGWMNSPHHKDNILMPHYDRSGMGVAISQDNRVYITQNFC